MKHEELIRYVVNTTKIKTQDMGAVSMTFKGDGVHVTVFRSGKKIKDQQNSKIMYGLSEADALSVCRAVQMELVQNNRDKITPISLDDRLSAMRVNKATQDGEDWE